MTWIGWLAFGLLLSAKALVVLAAAYGLTRMMGTRSAAERHLVWMLASACVLALPALSLAGPAWRINLPGLGLDRAVVAGEATSADVHAVFDAVPVEVQAVFGAAKGTSSASRSERVSKALGTTALTPAAGTGWAESATTSEPTASRVQTPASIDAKQSATPEWSAIAEQSAVAPQSVFPARSAFPALLLLIWLTGSLVVLTRIAVGFVRVHRLARSARPLLDPALLVRTHGIAAEIGLHRPMRLLEGEVGAMPVTFGVVRPTLLLPSSARGWSGARQNAVLRHELEHVRRRDSLSQLIAELGCALYWFNPLIWRASRRMCVEREHACDDAVLASGSRASEYAAELLEIARTLNAPRPTAIAAIAMARTSHLKQRVASLLDERRRERTSTRLLVPAWIGAFMLTMPLSSLAFEMGGRMGQMPDDSTATVAVQSIVSGSSSARAWSKHSEPEGRAALALSAAAVDTPPAPMPAPAPLSWPTPAHMSPPAAPMAAPAPLSWPTPAPMSPPAAPMPALAPQSWPTPAPMSPPGAPMPALAPQSWPTPAPMSPPAAPMPALAPPSWSAPDAPLPAPAPDAPQPPSFAARVGNVFARVAGSRHEQQDCLSNGRNVRINSNTDDRRRRTTWEGNDCSGEVVVEGDVEFDADFTTITGISSDGRVRITTEEDGRERRVTITPASSGLSYDYRVDGDRRQLDAEGREWLSSTLLFMFRRFGFMAEERAASIVQRGGAPALLAEVDVLTTDYVRARYLTVLIERGQLNETTLNRVLTMAGNTIDSDHYRTQIITAVAGRYEFTDGVRSAYIDAVSRMDSDHYRHRAFSTLLTKGRLSPTQVSAVLGQSTRIGSDHYRARLLDELSSSYSSTPAIRAAYLAAATSINSDHYKAGVLSDLLAMDGLASSDLAQVVNTAGTIGSDHYRARVLTQAAESGLSDTVLQTAFLRSAAGIASDHHLHSVLATVAGRDNLDNATMLALLDAASGIDSDHYRSRLLVQIIERHRLEGEARTRVDGLMRGIGSATWRGRVAEALLRGG